MTHRFSWLLGWSRLGMSLLAGALVAVAGCSAEPIDARRAALASSCLAGEVHREIRLGALLTAERRAGLAALGVHVIALRGEGWFSARAPLRVFQDLVGQHGVIAVRELDAEAKIAADFARTLRGGARASAWVLFASDSDDEQARCALRSRGFVAAKRVGVAPIYRVALDERSARSVASLDAVRAIAATPRWRPLLDESRKSIKVEALHAIDTSVDPPKYVLGGQGTVGGVWDPDGVDIDHPDLKPKALRLPLPANAPSIFHGTAVSGCMLGSGAQSTVVGWDPYQVRGMAPEAKLVAYLTSGDKDAQGVERTFPEQYVEARDRFDIDVLSFSFSHSSKAIYGPSAANLDFVLSRWSSKLPQPVPIAIASSNDGWRDGYGSVSSLASSKNAITVGGTDWADGTLWNASGFGPTGDGRVKPEVLAPGCASHGKVRFALSAVRVIPDAGSSAPVISWTFDTDGDAEGWHVVRHLDTPVVAGGEISARTTGGDPGFRSPDGLSIDTSVYKTIEVDMSLERHHRGEIFWKTDKNDWSGRLRRGFIVRNDGKIATYKIDVGADDDWKDTVVQIRVDAVVSGIALTTPGGGYTTSCGTSFSTPMIAGSVLLMTQAYRARPDVAAQGATAERPPPALYRALLVATANDLVGEGPGTNPDTGKLTVYPEGPDHASGYGEADIARAVSVISSSSQGFAVGRVAETGSEVRYRLRVAKKPARDLSVTLAWDDPPGEPGALKILQNDLDLTVTHPDGKKVEEPWHLAPPGAAPTGQSTRTADHHNNIEKVPLGTPEPGDYIVTVRAHQLTHAQQSFALALSEADDVASLTADADGDGSFADVDCDDSDPAVHPGASEVPGNGKDDDCNASTPDTLPADATPSTQDGGASADIATPPAPVNPPGRGCSAAPGDAGATTTATLLLLLLLAAVAALVSRRRQR
ncbi:MAG: S8 family serine peptidase [Myxococcales bacterium]|nr:S8 family serine peptidase [Myxococcales bacterium]